jgi:hypothetical protein
LRLRILLAALAALCALAAPAVAKTARDLSGRMHIDGYTDEFITNDEDVFATDPQSGKLQESHSDSKWGENNEIYQIRITWDANNLYLAGEGKIWGNNLILFMDTIPDTGIVAMTQLNSWRRNFYFDSYARFAGDEFEPDVFGATWDTNTNPRLLTFLDNGQVDDRQVGPEFQAAASFNQGNDGRAMEFAIPWRNVFAGLKGRGTRDTTATVAGVTQVFHRMPLGVHSIKIAAVITGGADGTGGPDSAPDNLSGHTDNGNDPVQIDNYAIVDLDQADDTGMGAGRPDGIPDWGIKPVTRISFRYPPPIEAQRFALKDLTISRPVIAPDRGERVRFHARVVPPLNPGLPVDRSRKVTTSANVYDLAGHQVRQLYTQWTTLALHFDEDLDSFPAAQWDGRDNSGRIVPAGIYILRVVIDQNIDRATRSIVVVR